MLYVRFSELIVDECFNPDLESIVSPLDVQEYENLLEQSGYPRQKINMLVNGFTNGFDLGFRGPRDRVLESKNLKLRVGTKRDLWNKIMKEVRAGRFAGGFRRPPFQFYVQSPLGNVTGRNSIYCQASDFVLNSTSLLTICRTGS